MEPDFSGRSVQADGINNNALGSVKDTSKASYVTLFGIVLSVGYISLQMMIRHDGLLMQKAIDEFVVVF